MNYTTMFYWMTRADDVKGFFDTCSNWFLAFTIICTAIYIITSILVAAPDSGWSDSDIQDMKYWKKSIGKLMSFCMVILIITWSLYVLIPTKKEVLLIAAAGGVMKFMTTDSSAKKLPSEVMNFVVTELRGMANQAKVDIGINEQKSKILEEAKSLSASDLIDRIRKDSTLRDIILDK